MKEAPVPLTHLNLNLYKLQALQNLQLALGAATVLADLMAACQAPSLLDTVGKTPHRPAFFFCLNVAAATS